MRYSFKNKHLLLLIMGHRQENKYDQDNFLCTFIFEHLVWNGIFIYFYKRISSELECQLIMYAYTNELTRFGWWLLCDSSQASFTVQERPLMGLVKKRIPRETKNELFIKHWNHKNIINVFLWKNEISLWVR